MKKIIVLMIGIASLAACQKIKNLANISFSIPYAHTVTVPAVPYYNYGMALPDGGVNLPFPPVSVAINAQQYFDEYHASSENLVSATLGNANLQIISSGNDNFNFLDTIQLFISTPTLPEILVAYDYNIPSEQTMISLTPVPNVNLKNYITGDSVTVWLDAHISYVPQPGMQVNLSGNFNIVANPL